MKSERGPKMASYAFGGITLLCSGIEKLVLSFPIVRGLQKHNLEPIFDLNEKEQMLSNQSLTFDLIAALPHDNDHYLLTSRTSYVLVIPVRNWC